MKKGTEVIAKEAEVVNNKKKKKSLLEKMNLKSSENAKFVIDKQSLELHVQLISNPLQYGQQFLGELTKFQIFMNELWEIIGKLFKFQKVYEYTPQ